MRTPRRSYASSSVLVLLLACRGGEETAGDTGVVGPVASCPSATELAWSFECTDDYWSGFLWTDDGCLEQVIVDAWAPLHHERHAFERVDLREGVETWTLGPMVTGVSRWAPQASSRWRCEEHEGLTWALRIYGAEGLLSCEAWGPDAAAVAGLPGARPEHADCPSLR